MYELNSYQGATTNSPTSAYSVKDITALSTRLAIPNNTTATWWVSIQTYYYNEGDTTKPSRDNSNVKWFNIIRQDASNNPTASDAYWPIQVGPGPNSGSLQVVDQLNKTISLTYTLPTLVPSYPYPVNRLRVFNNNTHVQTIDASASNPAIFFPYGSSQSITISSGLKNGSLNTIRVEPVRNYTYAQNPPASTVTNVVPYSHMQIDSSSSSITDGGRYLTTVVKMNGDPLQSAVVIARDLSGSLVVSPVQSGAFYTTSGSEDSNTVANQTAAFNTSFTNPMQSFLVAAIGTRSSDIGVIPFGANWGSIP
jgi:hypothetical protein